MDDYLPLALSIVLAINFVLFGAQISIDNLTPELDVLGSTFYDASGSPICNSDLNNCAGDEYILNDTDPTGQYPSTDPIQTDDGNFFTDLFSSVKTWLSQGFGLGYVIQVLSAPKNFLDLTGLPSQMNFALASLWYLFTLFILVAFMWGR